MWTKLNNLLTSFVIRAQHESGQVLDEYALILGIASITAVALLAVIGHDVDSLLTPVAEGFEKA